MENNGKGMSIFYGVIGVATLVITIIGATFAYFSATTNSDVDAVTAGGATLSLAFSDKEDGPKTDLIPINVTLPEFNTGPFVGGVYEDDLGDCTDINGNNICSVYEFTISNPSDNKASQRVYGTFVPNTNSFTNLKFAVFKGTVKDVQNSTKKHAVSKKVVADDIPTAQFNQYTDIKLTEARAIPGNESVEVGATIEVQERIGWDVDGDAVEDFTTTFDSKYVKDPADASRKHVIGDPGDLVHTATALTKDSKVAITIPAWEQVLDVGESRTYTIVMWINETGSQQNDDQTKSFAGGINFTTEGNNTGVTGVLSTTSK